MRTNRLQLEKNTTARLQNRKVCDTITALQIDWMKESTFHTLALHTPSASYVLVM